MIVFYIISVNCIICSLCHSQLISHCFFFVILPWYSTCAHSSINLSLCLFKPASKVHPFAVAWFTWSFPFLFSSNVLLLFLLPIFFFTDYPLFLIWSYIVLLFPPVSHTCIPALCPCTVDDYYYPTCFQALNLLPPGVSHASLHSFLQSRLKMHTAFPAATPLVTGEYDSNYVHLNMYSRILTRARLFKEKEEKQTHSATRTPSKTR